VGTATRRRAAAGVCSHGEGENDEGSEGIVLPLSPWVGMERGGGATVACGGGRSCSGRRRWGAGARACGAGRRCGVGSSARGLFIGGIRRWREQGVVEAGELGGRP